MSAFEVLQERGFVQQSTDAARLAAALDAGSLTFYCGFDPSGDSLHVGHLVPVMAMTWLARAGHKPIVVMGGGTGLIGDPSGKEKARDLISKEEVKANLESQRIQFQRFVGDALVVDNAEWLCELRYIDFLRDIGRHFSVNRMLSAEGTKQRLERDQGLSFIEFNYHLLQSYDWLALYEKHGCRLQIGGDDQWFNILGGADLIRRVHGDDSVHALTVPLIMTADGKKMGKTEHGAVWLKPERLPVYDYFQYWLNVTDADVGRFLRLYTMLPMDEVHRLEALQGADIREAKRALALEATALAHGTAAAEVALRAAQEAFSGAASDAMPTHRTTLPQPLVVVLADSGLCASKSAARRLITQGGASVGDERVTDPDYVLDRAAVVWAGKKRAVNVVAG